MTVTRLCWLLAMAATARSEVYFPEVRPPGSIRVGVILPYNPIWLFSRPRVEFAMELAVQEVERQGLLPSLQLNLRYADSMCSIADGMNEAINFYAQDNVNVLFGPACDYAAAPVARQVRYWRLAMITAGAMAHDFGRSKTELFPTLTRVGPHFSSLVDFVHALIVGFGWSKVRLIYNPEDFHDVTQRFCHIAADGLHFKLRSSHMHHDYEKFHYLPDILEKLKDRIGRDFGDLADDTWVMLTRNDLMSLGGQIGCMGPPLAELLEQVLSELLEQAPGCATGVSPWLSYWSRPLAELLEQAPGLAIGAGPWLSYWSRPRKLHSQGFQSMWGIVRLQQYVVL